MQANKFTYLDFSTEHVAENLIVRFNFQLDNLTFQEVLTFPVPELLKINLEQLNDSLSFLHLILGISYYKAGVPSVIETKNYTLDQKQALFFQETFFHGLQEFAYRNQLDLRSRINFPYEAKSSLESVTVSLDSGAIIPMGGGKDSMLCLQILKDQAPLLLTLGTNPQVQEIAKIKNLALVEITREIDPLLLKVNQAGAYNGHVPFSAILGMVSVVAGLLYGKKYLVLGNERSANEANLEYLGTPVNHQFSKSFYFEKLFNAFVKEEIHPEVNYFSILRQFSEAQIARELAKHPEYLDIFASCNFYKKIDSNQKQKWCAKCAKCCFVFLCLAPFVTSEKMTDIFGANLLEDTSLLPEFMRLIGKTEHKPWECVGEYAECRDLFRILNKDFNYQNTFVVKEVIKLLTPETESDLFVLHEEHLIPDYFKNILDEYLKRD